MSQFPIDTSCEAEYADGYILSETEHSDISPFDPQFNVLRAIIDKHPEAEHGPMVRFSVFYKDNRYDVDWTTLPPNARPIRFRDGYFKSFTDGSSESGWSGLRFGYQYLDKNGKNIKEVQEL